MGTNSSLGCWRRLCVGLTLVSVLGQSRVSNAAQDNDTPFVLVLDVPGTRAIDDLRERFARELGLTLDEFAVVRVKAAAGFSKRSLADQLRIARPLMRRYRAIAATWVDQPLADMVLLTMLVVDGERVMVRTIPSERIEQSESDLALAARELLGSLYLLEPDRPPAVQQIVTETVQTAVGSAVEPPSPEPRSQTLALRLGIGLASALDTSENYPVGFALSGGVHWSLPAGFELHGLAEVEAGRASYTEPGRVEYIGVYGRLGLGYRIETSSVSIIPTCAVRLGYQHTQATPTDLPSADREGTMAWVSGGAEVRVGVTQGLALVLTPKVELDTNPSQLRRRSDDQVLMRTPGWRWAVEMAWLAYW